MPAAWFWERLLLLLDVATLTRLWILLVTMSLSEGACSWWVFFSPWLQISSNLAQRFEITSSPSVASSDFPPNRIWHCLTDSNRASSNFCLSAILDQGSFSTGQCQWCSEWTPLQCHSLCYAASVTQLTLRLTSLSLFSFTALFRDFFWRFRCK